MNRTRLFIADDHVMVREGFRLLLSTQDDMEIVGEAGDGHSALEMIRDLELDVVLMDIAMPGLSGLEATRRIKEQLPEVHVLAITGSDSEDVFFKALKAGASGYVLKGGTGSELVDAVRTVVKGDLFLQPRMTTRLMEDYLLRVRAGQEQDSYGSLSDREREVLQFTVEGYTNQEIGRRLYLSPSTVQTHRTHAMEKLNISSRAELMRYAMRKGLFRMSSAG